MSHSTHYRSFQGDDQTNIVKALKETSWSMRSGLNPTKTTPPCYNKFAQSNLGRGLRRGAVAHIRHKALLNYNGAPQICPQKSTPSHKPIPKRHYLHHPWTRPTYDAKRHPDPICRFATMHWTDQPMHVHTDRQTVHGKV